MTKNFVLLFAASSIALMSHCTQEFPAAKQSGTIRYRLTPAKSDSVFQKQPGELTFYFDGSKTCKSMILGDGNMRIRSVADALTRKHVLLLEGLNKNMSMIVPISASNKLFHMEETGRKFDYLGYSSDELCININSTEHCEIYQSRELGTAGLNWNTPYKNTDGVLLRYLLIYRNVTLIAEAIDIQIGSVDPEVFLLPSNTAEVKSSEEMIIY